MIPQATRRLRPVTLAACITAATLGCGGDDAARDPETGAAVADIEPSAQVATAYAPELGVDLAAMSMLPSGLYLRDLETGEGEEVAQHGDRVAVEYTGWLSNGVQFESSQGNPISFTLGVGEVIPGWEEGIAGMHTGGRRILVVPPALAYGDRGRAGVIPPGATLVFDVRLADIAPDTTAVPPDTSSTRN